MNHDEILRIVEQHWDSEVQAGCGYTVPVLTLTRELIEEYIADKRDELPDIEDAMAPRHLLEGMEGKDVLCLASGGGQQSAVFGLLGAEITVLDLCEGQLEADRAAAQHYGYEVNTVKGDACDLSCFADASFDLVYQAPSMGWIPDVRAVYRGVHRVQRLGGLYRVAMANPTFLAHGMGRERLPHHGSLPRRPGAEECSRGREHGGRRINRRPPTPLLR